MHIFYEVSTVVGFHIILQMTFSVGCPIQYFFSYTILTFPSWLNPSVAVSPYLSINFKAIRSTNTCKMIGNVF